MTKQLSEVMTHLANYTLAWHHWLIVLSLVKLGGCGTMSQILPVFKKEGFSPHALEGILRKDLEELGEAVRFEGSLESLQPSTMIHLCNDPRFESFIRKHLKPVAKTLRTRTSA